MTWEVAHDDFDEGCFYRTLNWDGGFPRWRLSVQFKDEDEEMPSRISIRFGYAAHEPEPFMMEDELDPALLGHLAELILKAHAKYVPCWPQKPVSGPFEDGAVQGILPQEEAVGAFIGMLTRAIQIQQSDPGLAHMSATEVVGTVARITAQQLRQRGPDNPAAEVAERLVAQFVPEPENE